MVRFVVVLVWLTLIDLEVFVFVLASLNQVFVLVSQNRVFVLASLNQVFVLVSLNRVFVLASQNRVFVLASLNRVFVLVSQNHVFVLVSQNRVFVLVSLNQVIVIVWVWQRPVTDLDLALLTLSLWRLELMTDQRLVFVMAMVTWSLLETLQNHKCVHRSKDNTSHKQWFLLLL
jgi:hypothetical protein